MGKGSKERVVAINIKTVKHVKQYLDVYRLRDNPDTNLLFYTIIKGRAGKISEGNVERGSYSSMLIKPENRVLIYRYACILICFEIKTKIKSKLSGKK